MDAPNVVTPDRHIRQVCKDRLLTIDKDCGIVTWGVAAHGIEGLNAYPYYKNMYQIGYDLFYHVSSCTGFGSTGYCGVYVINELG